MNYSHITSEQLSRKEKLKRLNFIMDFNFNKDFGGECTVEETIMKELTNDLGEPILAHVAHTLISEFRKFMFLISENFIELRLKEIEHSHDNDQPENNCNLFIKSLIAPPTIDLIWV